MAEMTAKQMMHFMLELEKVSTSLKVATENTEHVSGDPVVSDFLQAFDTLKTEIDTVTYAMEQVLTARSSAGF